MQHLTSTDPDLAALIDGELHRQQETLVMIASENYVSPAVLIPRPETEVIVEQAIRRLRARVPTTGQLRVLDAGTGSGNIAISLALAVPSCVVVALELSYDALRIAQANVARHQLTERVTVVRADWSGWVASERFDLILSNPPYVSSAEMERLSEVVRREPPQALDGGADGLDAYRVLLARIPQWRAMGGIVGFECADTRHEILSALCAGQPWVRRLDAVQDLAGRPRGLFLETY